MTKQQYVTIDYFDEKVTKRFDSVDKKLEWIIEKIDWLIGKYKA